jgi:3-hydroxyisobutyrate dehydrogenase
MASDPIAVLGAGGTIGLAMARNLLGAGIEVHAWNRTSERAAPLADDGARVAASAAEATAEASVILTVLSDAEATLDVAHDALPEETGAGEAEVLWLQMGTIGLEGTSACAELASERGVILVDAPVLGTKEPAEAGELIMLASGPESAKPRCAPYFEAVGKKTMWLGEAGAGSRLKLVANAWILSIVEGLAETIALAERLDVDPADFLDAIEGGPLDAGYAHLKGKAMQERDFEPSFRLALAAKDAALVERAARERGAELPLVSAVRARLEEAVDEHGDLDMAATFLTSARDDA